MRRKKVEKLLSSKDVSGVLTLAKSTIIRVMEERKEGVGVEKGGEN